MKALISGYVRIALRGLTKNKLGAGIEIFGLAIGLAACLLIFLFVRQETSYDDHYTRADDVYRAWAREDYGADRTYFNTFTPITLADALDASTSGIDATIRVGTMSDVVASADQRFTTTVHIVDSDFLQVFDLTTVNGDASHALANPNSAVVTSGFARRMFGRIDAVGEVLSIRFGDRFEDFRITAVTQPIPANTSLRFDVLIPFAVAPHLYDQEAMESWFSVTVETYVLASPGVTSAQIERQFPAMLASRLGDAYERSNYTVGLQPLRDIHLDTSFPPALARTSDPAYCYILGAIALLVLMIAGINYMTLAIGRSTKRAVEVGVRKSIGADRRLLMRQFWGEAMLTTFIALLVGLGIAETFRPLFSALSGTEIGSPFQGESVLFSLVLCCVVGLVAGSYPAVVLSRFQPADVLKGSMKLIGNRSMVRRALVTLQFALSVFLITATLVMGRQFNLLREKPLGFDKDHLIAVPIAATPSPDKTLDEVIREGMSVARVVEEQLRGKSGIQSVAAAGHTFGEGWTSIGFKDAASRYYDMQMNTVDASYIDVMGMTMEKGRAFSEQIPSDSRRAIIVNEALVSSFGLENPVGGHLPGTRFPDHEIIGVVKDFHYESLHGRVRPLVLTMNPGLLLEGASDVSFDSYPTPRILVRVSATDLPSSIQAIQKTIETVAPDQDFQYSFIDAAIDAQYRQEERLSQIVEIASWLAIIIACLGLFGLAGLTVVRRTKEIGVRRVLGASPGRVFWLLSRDFGWMILAATFVAAPVVYLVMEEWLQDFAYRVSVTLDVLATGGLIVLAIALLTVTYHGLQAARLDPVKCLRYE